jgi:hypothetical protein
LWVGGWLALVEVPSLGFGWGRCSAVCFAGCVGWWCGFVTGLLGLIDVGAETVEDIGRVPFDSGKTGMINTSLFSCVVCFSRAILRQSDAATFA